MNLTLDEFRDLIELYRNNELSEEELKHRNLMGAMHAVIAAASILEDSSSYVGEKKYLIKCIYDSLVGRKGREMLEALKKKENGDTV